MYCDGWHSNYDTFCRTGHYDNAVELWKKYRADITNTPHSSTTYELLMSVFRTPEMIEALRLDMLKLGVVMSDKCGLAYAKLLVDNRRTNEVIEFIKRDLVLRVYFVEYSITSF